jgi:valyl-tRNA synthetase
MDSDRWILSELDGLIEECRRGYEEYNVFVPATKVREFLWNVFTAHYLEMTKARAYGDTGSQGERDAACYTLHRVMKSLLLLMAPITPHITDHLWRKLYGTGSIHGELFPEAGDHRLPEGITEALVEFNTLVWKSKRDGGLALKEPIQIAIPEKLLPYAPDLVRMHHITS